jgi:hypothetical protein
MAKMVAENGNIKIDMNFVLFCDFTGRNYGFTGRLQVNVSFLNRGFCGVKTREAESQ